MTLEEAKKKIKELADSKWVRFHNEGNLITSGEAMAYEEAGHILDEVDTEPVGISEQLTLKELARELRKVFIFDYVTIDDDGTITSWRGKPLYISTIGVWDRNAYLGSLDIFHTDISCTVDLDLSEYTDADGNIDYSKCIVEVSE